MSDPSIPIERCEVCIVGAGIAGLNALFVASQYLSRGDTVILIDRRKRVGGMWVDTYPYVRLHQPHPTFTVGNITWTLGKDRAHLATKTEVLDHFEHCLNVIRRRVDLCEFFGWTLESDTETPDGVNIRCTAPDGRRHKIIGKRFIKAIGFNVAPNDPLPISSMQVRSISPDFCDMRSEALRDSASPVWVIGGGKTAMDTAHTLITTYPGREVNMVAGSGTYFMSRDRILPNGLKRWWGGELFSRMGLELAHRFDGTNEAAVADWFRTTYGTWLTPSTANFVLGVLSEAENATIAAGLGQVTMDHFVDVVDRDNAPELVLRAGAALPLEPGSWIVNCTGYFKPDNRPYEPYLSPGGSVLSINVRSATLHLTYVGAYFMTHLLFLDKLRGLPLYELDALELRRIGNAVLPYTLITMAVHNMSLIVGQVPSSVILKCGCDINQWYPAPRRMVAGVRYLRVHRREREHQRRTLDTIAKRFDVRCAPLRHE